MRSTIGKCFDYEISHVLILYDVFELQTVSKSTLSIWKKTILFPTSNISCSYIFFVTHGKHWTVIKFLNVFFFFFSYSGENKIFFVSLIASRIVIYALRNILRLEIDGRLSNRRTQSKSNFLFVCPTLGKM